MSGILVRAAFGPLGFKVVWQALPASFNPMARISRKRIEGPHCGYDGGMRLAIWILVSLVIVIDVPTLIAALGKPSNGGTILAVLSAAFLGLLCAIAAGAMGLALFMRPADRATGIAPLAAGIIALAGAAVVMLYALLSAKWH